ncbi:4,5-dihydroxyphthalate decarboxylase [Alicyclobacillus acidoterrestris]|uniref:ABC transporter substrate-binding protein n=1 Tax=Alicyclobacillus suci TaxID=2816080 RepID=UPI0011935137|nr:ABC transporter substrate-binding protein [Alicyclobacillus suci]GEO26615.1 4,5-dihydroxyphthalate decarboxylase [Alicyclobacillus acidoterrestris]
MRTPISVAMSISDRTLPLLTNQVELNDVQLSLQSTMVEEIFERQLNDAPYGIAELSLASYLIALAKGEHRLTAIPAFLSRSFRHSSIYVRSDSPYVHPSELKGKRFGFPEYQMTAAVWVRGCFRHEWGISAQDLEWVTYRPERIAVDTPATRGKAKDLFEGLVTGEVDAMMSARRPPEAYFPKTGEPGLIRRIFVDAWAEERRYYAQTGIFPIMHLTSIRKDVLTQAPTLPRDLYDVLCQLKEDALNNLAETVKLGAALPWIVESFEQAYTQLHQDPWSYGVTRNWPMIETFMQYLMEDGLLDRMLTREEVFHPSVLDT